MFEDSTAALTFALQLLAVDAALVPFPGFPSAGLACAHAQKQLIPYFLDQSTPWEEALDELSIEMQRQGADWKVLIVQNPHPAGQLLSEECLGRCLRLAAEHGIALLVQEDDSLIHGTGDFVSCRSLAESMNLEVPMLTCFAMQDLAQQMAEPIGAALHMRRPAMEPKSASLRAQVWMASLLSGIPSDSVAQPAALAQSAELRAQLSRNALEAQKLNHVSGMSCAAAVAGAHIFPEVVVKGFVMKKAISLALPADEVYCSELLARTGISTQPGGYFGQRPGTFRFRMSMMQSTSFSDALDKVQKFHEEHPRGWFY